jgi:uncharacterized protein YbjT (DUF2867 family)
MRRHAALLQHANHVLDRTATSNARRKAVSGATPETTGGTPVLPSLMNVFVTGATGFVGREIVRQLHDGGHHIHFLSRNVGSANARAVEWGFEGQVHFGNILEANSLGDACKGVDAIIHLVGIISEVGEQTFENLHTRGTQNIVAAAKLAGVKRFVHMSALGTRPDAVSRYHKSKWAAEEIVRGSGLDWTIFRPSIIYGPGDGFVNLFARMSHVSPALPLIGGGRTKFQPIPVGSVAQCFVKALTETRSIGRTFDLCGDEVLTLRQIVEAILTVTHRRRFKLPIPFAVARLQAAALEFVYGKLLRKPPPLNRDQLLMLREDNVGDGKAASSLFALPQAAFVTAISPYLGRPN